MRLLENLPQLPYGECQLWTHKPDEKNLLTFDGAEVGYNALRRQGLAQLAEATGHKIQSLTPEELQAILTSRKRDLAFVYHDPLEDEGSRMVGGAIGRRKQMGEYASRMTVKELIVAPDLRERHIASFLLGRLSENTSPTEMVIDTTVFEPENWLLEKLKETGFNHTTKNGSPAIWLPGRKGAVHGNYDDPRFVSQRLQAMPQDWNGYWEFYPRTDPQLQIFRDGKLAGIVRPVDGTVDHDDHGVRIKDFTLTDAGNAELAVLEGVSETEAMITLLNKPNKLAA